jgi:transitional endoplasmic reticulum ATPase
VWSALVWPAIVLFAIFLFYRLLTKRTPAERQVDEMKQLAATGWAWVPPRYRMNDVAGLHSEVREQIDEVVDMFRHPADYRAAGAVPPRGVLLSGPSGVGKTMLAHVLAAEAGIDNFCIVTGPSLMGPFVGLPAMRIHKIFEEARAKGRCLIFFDEFDVAGAARRQHRLAGVEAESHQLVVQLIAEIDALRADDKILLAAATNRLDMLDPALLRMGRFDRQIEIDLPGPDEREDILTLHGARKKVAGFTFRQLARGTSETKPHVTTSGYSGADLAALLNESAIQAVKSKARSIALEHVARANRRIRAAMTRRSANETEEGMSRTLARLDSGEQRITFDEVGGQERAKEELRIVVEYLRDPEKFEKAQCRIPKGILLTGPPGIGKTLLARAVAGEAVAPFFHTSGAEFVQMWVGVAAARVRDLFRIARRQSPCIVFIDELDALAGRRSNREAAGGEEYSHALNQLLAELDGFADRDRVVVIGATNRVDVLDEAILRPGRMDSIVEMKLPDQEERREILDLYVRGGLSDEELRELARMTHGRSGADLEMLVNAARIHSVRDQRLGKLTLRDVTEVLQQQRVRTDRSLRQP